jgi:glycosyltransferase involved in cell wall biosynthesis
MKIFANISEAFQRQGGNFVSKSVSAKFLQRIPNVIIASPVIKTDDMKINATIVASSFVALPEFDSAFSFIKQYVISSRFRRTFKSTIKKEIQKSDKVWVRAPSIDSILVAIIALKMKKPVIMHIAGDLEGVWINKKYTKVKTIFAFFFAKFLLLLIKNLSKSKNVYILSTGNDLNVRYSNSVNGSRIFFDTCLDIPKKNNLIASSCKPNIIRLLYVGRLETDKGVLTLCEVMSQLNLYFSDKQIYLTIVGFGDAENELRSQISAYGLESIITQLGFVNSDDLSQVYLSHDIFVFPSMAPEGFPRVIQEAWLHGLPVVTSDTGGITGVAIDGKNAVIFKAGNTVEFIEKLIALIDNTQVLEDLRNNILSSREAYSAPCQERIALNRIEEAYYSG